MTQDIQAKKEAVEVSTEIPDGLKPSILDLYDQAIDSVVEAQAVETQSASLESRVEAAASHSASLRKQLSEKVPNEALPDELDTRSLSEIENLVRQYDARLQAARAELYEREQALDSVLKSETTLSAEITDLNARLRSLQQDLESPPPANESAALIEARRTAVSARHRLRDAELSLLELRLSSHETIVLLETLQRDVAARSVSNVEFVYDQLQTRANVVRQEEAIRGLETAEAAKSRVRDLPTSVRQIAENIIEKNVQLRAELEELVRKEVKADERLRSVEQQSESVIEDFAATRRRIEIAGSTDAIGRMLRRRLAALPSLGFYHKAASERRAEINVATDRQLEIDEQRRRLIDEDRQPGSAVPAPAVNSDESTTNGANRQMVEQLLRAQQQSLTELHGHYIGYVSQLVTLDVAERELLDSANEYAGFIQERLLWIRSLPAVSLVDVTSVPAAIGWLASPANWSRVIQDLVYGARANALILLICVLVALSVPVLSRGAGQRLESLAVQTLKARTDAFSHTVKALGETLILAAVRPAPLLVAGLFLGTIPSAHAFSNAAAGSLMATAAFWFTVEVIRNCCRDSGLGDSHFCWPAPVRKELNRHLGWFVIVAVPLMFVFMMVNEQLDQTELQQGLGRPVYVLLMLALAFLVQRLFGRSSAVTKYMLAHRAHHWLTHLRFMWYPMLLLVPVILAIASACGYHYTAVQYDVRGHATTWFLVAVFLIRELLLRWLYVHTRRLRFDEALKRRERARLKREQGDADIPSSDEFPPVEIPQVSFSELSEKARRLLKIAVFFGVLAGLWAIWKDLLPGFGFLNSVNLPLSATEFVDGVEKTVPVTLSDLLFALFVLGLVVVAAKNLSGLLEITLLQRLPLESGGRYAIVTLSQYSLVAAGVIAAFSAIGVQWSNIQWLVAALGVGLGFGLQEIVANFVSGIILLLERPIRVGDVVTVGDTSGVVSRIRIRATTIVNWNKQELVVPNKEFVTGRLLNWTLSDKMNRIVINVGVAYEADVGRAMELLMQVANSNENVLPEPVPVVTFDGFGDNALSLTLRCYLASLDNRLATISALHAEINSAFRESGIVIAYPQRDMHVDIRQPIDVRLNYAGNFKE